MINDFSISVVIPTHNRSSTLPTAINSVLNQSCRADEIIVIDDGSTDDTASVISSLDSKIQYIYQENHGVSHARNTGIKRAKYNWIAFLDSDDCWLPNKLELQLEAVRRSENFHLCHTNEKWIRNGVRVNPMNKHQKQGGYIFERCLALCLISPSSVLIKRKLLIQLGLFDESLPVCEDYDLWLRFCSKFPVLFLEEPLIVKYGGHADQLSKRHWGMDRFRIQSIENLLAKNTLNDIDHQNAVAMLAEKCNILRNGASKRKNDKIFNLYTSILAKYQLDVHSLSTQ
jgi:glycosyltransferase involved in cell wall biosynthesis